MTPLAVTLAFHPHALHPAAVSLSPTLSFLRKPPCPSTELIGYLAATLTTCSFVPQAWHTFRTRDVSGISLGMYSVFTTGVALWLAYGIALQAWPIVVANAITLLLASTIPGHEAAVSPRARRLSTPLSPTRHEGRGCRVIPYGCCTAGARTMPLFPVNHEGFS